MTGLTTFQRKLLYLGIIVALLIPINLLGRPSGKPKKTAADGPQATKEDTGGGVLARLRNEHDLGESNLGDVDPSSATMNLVLVGLRGFAASQLWQQAQEHQEHKNWAALEDNVKSIILLQPHFVRVWEFQSWNLAYNVSAEWDLIQDRYHWIKEGAKFAIRGTRRNAKSSELYWWVGIILGDKISRHDAWRYLRKFFNPAAYDKKDRFVGDPLIRERTNGEEIVPDRELNPGDGIDNFLIAKKWFIKANDADQINPQRRMAPVTFRQRPAKAHLAYAEIMQREGRFSEEATMASAWSVGLMNWTTRYEEGSRPGLGQEKFKTLNGWVRMGVDPADTKELHALIELDKGPQKFTVDNKLSGIAFLRGLVNYNYWQTRAEIESVSKTVSAHRALFDGMAALKANNLPKSIQELERGLQGFANLLIEKPELQHADENAAEEIMIALLAWHDAQNLLRELRSLERLPNEAIPWEKTPKLYQQHQALKKLFARYKPNLDEFKKIYLRELRSRH